MEGRFMAEPLNTAACTVTCIPRLRGGSGRRPPRRGAVSSSVSMMDRVRDVVLRLAMLSAASTSPSTTKAGVLQQHQQKAASPSRRGAGGSGVLQQQKAASPSRRGAGGSMMSPSSVYADSYRSEAVDDCIEFFKRSAAGGGASPAAAIVATSPLHASAAVPACAM